MKLFKKYFWLICFILGIIGFLITWFFLPHKSEIDNIWQLVFKLFAGGLIILSLSFFPNDKKFAKYGFLLVIIPFLGFTGYLLPRISYFGFRGIAYLNEGRLAGEYYTLLYLLLYPAIIFTTTFAYRMGGGTPGKCIKIAASGVLIIFSGFLDLLWYLVNPVEIPAILEYSNHIKIFLGPTPSYSHSIIFALCHIPFLVGLLLLPLDKWINMIFKPDGQELNKLSTPALNQQ